MNRLSSQCTATAKRSGQRCQQMVIGGGVCFKHGGAAPAVKRKRLERIRYAEALALTPRRPHAEVLGDVAHEADWLLKQARDQITKNRPDGETMRELVELAERAGRWAKTGLDADVDQRQMRVQEAHVMVLAGVVRRILARLNLTPGQQALVATVVPEEFDAAQLEAGGQS